jgi:DNA polymerase-3 subunit epsilon
MSWSDKTIAAFDLETTGLSPYADEIVQIAFIYQDGAGAILPESWTTIVNPERVIPSNVSAIHGITTERAIKDGVSLAGAIDELFQRLHDIATRDIPLTIYNAPFDLGFMQARAERRSTNLPSLNIIDPLVCDRHLDKYRRGARNLESVSRHYGLSPENLHDANVDAQLTASLARVMSEKYPEMRDSSFTELHEKQIAWHNDWAESYAKFMQSKGRRSNVARRTWPI